MVNVIKCSKNEFRKIIENEDLVCFGAGQELIRICEEFPSIVNRILFVIDNKKFGEEIELNGLKKRIRSAEDELIGKSNVSVVITTVNFADVFIRQMDENEMFGNKKVYFPYLYRDEAKATAFIADDTKEKKIPRKIHYCWFGENPIPDKFLKNIESWKKFCPDYELVFWNESNYDYTKNQYMYEAYRSKKWGFVPDYARLDIIDRYGGIYLDTDVELVKPLDDLLTCDLFCGFESNDYVAFGLGFGAAPNNKIIQEMMEYYETIHFLNEDGTMNLIASPVHQTSVLLKHGLKCDGSLQTIDGCTVFPIEYFAPINPYGLGEITDKTISIHKYAGTWLNEDKIEEKRRLTECLTFVNTRMICL
ncbi:MAG: hypothetical protein MJ119_03925 [Lachnospiraceae bacterium]|nr:hypothetical protein [Lachnospiraceae bacterium]